MRIVSFSLDNYKGFSSTGIVDIGNITSIVGKNSTGKSTIIEAIKHTLLHSSIDAKRLSSGSDQESNSIINFNDGNFVQNVAGRPLGNKPNINIQQTVNPIADNLSFISSETSSLKNIIQDVAWKNILSSLDLSPADIASELSQIGGVRLFEENRTMEISQKLSETFNKYVSECLGRLYEFKIGFEFNSDSSKIVVSLLGRYKQIGESPDISFSSLLIHESPGFKTLITLISYLLNGNLSNSLFILDEPFTNIHPTAQTEVRDVLKSVSRDIQIIYTTHSPYLYQQKNTLYCVNESAGSLVIKTENQLSEEEQRQFIEEFTQIPPSDLHTIQVVRQAINDSKKLIVFVEGNSDKRYIEHAITQLDKDLLKSIDIIPCGGDSNVVHWLRLERAKALDKNLPELLPSRLGVLDPDAKIKGGDIPDESMGIFLFQFEKNKTNRIKSGIESILPGAFVDQIRLDDSLGEIMESDTKVRNKNRFQIKILEVMNNLELQMCFGELLDKIRSLLYPAK